ncbi:MAG: RHS repeat-associated core domain-containing protein [Myxococcota bacterium]
MKCLKISVNWLGLVTILSISSPASAFEMTFLHPDIAGSTLVATDQSGSLVWERVYRPFGLLSEVTHPGRSTEQSVAFTGYETDFEANLLYAGGRYYDPRLGIFYAMDPAEPGIDSLSQNRYIYSRQNPYKYVDPDGRIVETVSDAVSLGMGVHSVLSWNSETTYFEAGLDLVGIAVDATALAVPFVPGGIGLSIKATRSAKMVNRAADGSTMTRLGSKSDGLADAGRRVDAPRQSAPDSGPCQGGCAVPTASVLSQEHL